MNAKPQPQTVWPWILGAGLALFMTLTPYAYYRISFNHSKRLRTVTPELFFRSGCMTAAGLEETIRKHHIKTVINLMEEDPDPNLPRHSWGGGSEKESVLCERLDAKMLYMSLDLVHPTEYGPKTPEMIERFLKVMDEARAKKEPVLIHCKAGLNRTGCMVALYRMEYDGWSATQAMVELKRLGFGESTSTSANPYILQYVLGYQPRWKKTGTPGHLTSMKK